MSKKDHKKIGKGTVRITYPEPAPKQKPKPKGESKQRDHGRRDN